MSKKKDKNKKPSDKKSDGEKNKKPKKGKQKKKTAALLEGHFCTGCKKHCPLSNPHCKKGKSQAADFLKSNM